MNKLCQNLSTIHQVVFRLLNVFETNQYIRVFFLLFVATVSLSTLIFHSSFALGPDIAFHIYNAQRYLVEMQSGIFFPRWLGDWFGGYGAPVGVIYAPLLYIFSALIGLIGLDIVSSIKIILWVSIFLSGIFMYDLAKISMRSSSALLASALYMIAPYRLYDIVDRTALAEALAFTWLPLIILSMINLAQKQRGIDFIKLALAISLLILTHFLIAYLCLISFIFLGGYLVFLRKTNRLTTGISIILAGLLAAVLTAFYWLPAVLESRYLNTSWFVYGSGWGNYMNNFLFGAQTYINTRWEGVYKENVKISILALIYGFIGVLWIFQQSIRSNEYERSNEYDLKNELVYKYLNYWMFFLLCTSILMSLSISRPIWELLPKGELVAFPWRWLTLSSLAVAYLAGNLSHQIISMVSSGKAIQGSFPKIVYGLSIGIIIVYTMAAAYILWHNRIMLSGEVVSQLIGKMPLQTKNFGWVYADEYLPLMATKFEYASCPAYNQPKVLALHPIEFKVIKWQSTTRKIILFSKEKNAVNIRTFWFPGWKIFVNGEETMVSVDANDGTMTVKVPEGDSSVIAIFEDTPIRDLASKISLVGFILFSIVVLFCGVRLMRGNNQSENSHSEG